MRDTAAPARAGDKLPAFLGMKEMTRRGKRCEPIAAGPAGQSRPGGGFGPPHRFLIAKGLNPMEKEKEGESKNKQKRTKKFCSLFFLSKKK